MPFIRELDDLPWEARLSVAGTFVYYPKLNGANVAAETSPAPSFTITDPSGAVIQGPSAPTVTASGSVSYLSIPVDAINTLDERYQVRLTWRVDNATEDQYDVRLFDVVRHPFGQPSTSMNDMLEVRSDCGDVLDRMGQRLGQTAGDTSRTYAAGVCAVNARLSLNARICDQVRADGQVRPALILDRQRLARVEKFEALAHLYRNQAPSPDDGEDSNSRLYRHFRDMAQTAWAQIGPLAYDLDDDGVEDDTIDNLSNVTYFKRAQA